MQFAFDHTVMFGCDGAEVLCFRTADEEPTWKFAGRSPIVSVALAAPLGVALAQDGSVGWFDAMSGQLRASANAHPNARDLAVDAWGGAVVVHANALTVLDAMGTRALPVPQGAVLTTASFSPQSRLLAVGTEDGSVLFFDTSTGQFGASQRVSDRAVRSLAAVQHGVWLATAGESVFEATLTATRRITGMTGKSLGFIAYDPAVRHFGFQFDAKGAVFLDQGSLDTRLSVTYPERNIVGLGVVGPHGFAVGLDFGDANRFDARGQTCRTEPHPGRPRRSWLLMVGR